MFVRIWNICRPLASFYLAVIIIISIYFLKCYQLTWISVLFLVACEASVEKLKLHEWNIKLFTMNRNRIRAKASVYNYFLSSFEFCIFTHYLSFPEMIKHCWDKTAIRQVVTDQNPAWSRTGAWAWACLQRACSACAVTSPQGQPSPGSRSPSWRESL